MLSVLKKYFIAMGVYSIFTVLIIISCSVKTNYEIVAPGGTNLVGNRFMVEDGNDSGDLHSLFVYVLENSTPFQNFVGNMLDLVDVEEISSSYSHMTAEMWYKAGVIQREQSEEASIINAYKYASLENSNIKLHYTYTGAIVRLTTANTKILQLGDIITHLNDVEITSKDDLLVTNDNGTSLNFKVGDKVTIIRDEETIDIIRTESDEVGIAFYDKFNIYDADGVVNATPKIRIMPTNNVGPSAGMMQTLSIYNQLLDGNLNTNKIIGTGTIETDGSVGAIGGVTQKLYSAYQAGAKIMLVPSGNNYEDALVMYNKLKIKESEMKLIKVSNFEEVIACLK